IPMTEDHAFNNRTFYGATKIAGEQMARAFHHRYGLNYVGLRYMNVYGPRQDEKSVYTSVIMKVLEQIDGGASPVEYWAGSQAYATRIMPGVQKPHCSPCVSQKASWITLSSPGAGAIPSMVAMA